MPPGVDSTAYLKATAAYSGLGDRSTPSINHRHEIPGLDALRAAAIALVLLFHFGMPVSGPLGVMIFFVLSGFLITGILLKEFRKSGRISLRRFYSRRAFRIFPTFYACWLLTTVLMLIHHIRIGPRQALGSFFYATDYIRALSPDNQTGIHMWISWSLAIEEQFYFIWPALLLFLLKRKANLIRAVSLLITTVWIYRAVFICGFGGLFTYVYNAFEMRLDALMIGGLLAIVVESGALMKGRTALIRSPWLVAIPIGILVLVSLQDTSHYPIPTPLFVALFSLQPVVVSVLLLQVVHWSASQWAFLEHPSIKMVARLSYALYLYHVVAIDEAFRLLSGHRKTSAAIAAVILAFASYYLIERPMLRIRDRKPKKRSIVHSPVMASSSV